MCSALFLFACASLFVSCCFGLVESGSTVFHCAPSQSQRSNRMATMTKQHNTEKRVNTHTQTHTYTIGGGEIGGRACIHPYRFLSFRGSRLNRRHFAASPADGGGIINTNTRHPHRTFRSVSPTHRWMWIPVPCPGGGDFVFGVRGIPSVAQRHCTHHRPAHSRLCFFSVSSVSRIERLLLTIILAHIWAKIKVKNNTTTNNPHSKKKDRRRH